MLAMSARLQTTRASAERDSRPRERPAVLSFVHAILMTLRMICLSTCGTLGGTGLLTFGWCPGDK